MKRLTWLGVVLCLRSIVWFWGVIGGGMAAITVEGHSRALPPVERLPYGGQEPRPAVRQDGAIARALSYTLLLLAGLVYREVHSAGSVVDNESV